MFRLPILYWQSTVFLWQGRTMRKIVKQTIVLLTILIMLPCQVQAANVGKNVNIIEQCGLREFEVHYVDSVEEADIENTPKLRSGASGYWTKFSSDYFYNQFTVSQRNLYDALESVCFNYMESEDNMLDSSKTKYVPYSGMSSSEALNIAYIFALTEGQYYFLDDSVSIVCNGTSGEVSLGVYDEFVNGTARAAQTEELRQQLDSWLTEIKKETWQVARERKIHDIVVGVASYGENDYDQSCISILKYGTTVCAGYAKMFSMLCNAAGLEAVNLTSTTHAWNAVQINNAWYNVDCTWDDPVGGTRVYYTYFNKSDQTIQRGNNSHFVINKWYNYTTVPKCYSDEPVDAQITENTEAAKISVYRLYQPSNGEHLYTTDVHEKDVLYEQQGWGYEGIAWYAVNGKGEPVYRLYNANQQNHLYTTDVNEVNVLTNGYGWTKDFNGQPLFYSNGDAPVYRVYNEAQSGMHHLTTDQNEYNTLPQYGWIQEGRKISAIRIGDPITTKYCR